MSKKPRRKPYSNLGHEPAEKAELIAAIQRDYPEGIALQGLKNTEPLVTDSAPKVEEIIVPISSPAAAKVISLDDNDVADPIKLPNNIEVEKAVSVASAAEPVSAMPVSAMPVAAQLVAAQPAAPVESQAVVPAIPEPQIDYSFVFASMGTQRHIPQERESLVDQYYKPGILPDLDAGGYPLADLVCEGISMVIYRKFRKTFVPSPDYIKRQLPAKHNLKDIIDFVNKNSICSIRELAIGSGAIGEHQINQAKLYGIRIMGFYAERLDQIRVCVHKHFPLIFPASGRLSYMYTSETQCTEPGVALCVTIGSLP